MTSRGSAFVPRASYTQLGVSWSVENTSSPIISPVIIRGRRRLGSPGRPQKKKPQQPSDAYSCTQPFCLIFFSHQVPSFSRSAELFLSFFFIRYKRFTTGALKNKKIIFRHWRRPFSLLPWPFDPLFFTATEIYLHIGLSPDGHRVSK